MKTINNPSVALPMSQPQATRRPIGTSLSTAAIRRAISRAALVASCILAPWAFLDCAATAPGATPSFPLIAAAAVSVFVAIFLPEPVAKKGGRR